MDIIKNILGKKTRRRQNKTYIKGQYGYNIRFHKTQNPSSAIVDAIEEFIDQISLRKQEWGLIGTNSKQGYTNLASNVIRGHDLRGKDLEDFKIELKARKYSIDYSQL